MSNKKLLNSAFESYQELWRSRKVLSASAKGSTDNTLLDLHNSSKDTQPEFINC